jgi:hypothetical protein
MLCNVTKLALTHLLEGVSKVVVVSSWIPINSRSEARPRTWLGSELDTM